MPFIYPIDIIRIAILHMITPAGVEEMRKIPWIGALPAN